MTDHKVGTREEWLAARLELLKAEKELTRRSDELAQWRQELPWVRIDKEYHFETEKGPVTLADLFKGRSQLLVYHFMFGHEYMGGCPACSAIADGFNGFAVHLENHDVAMVAVSRAPIPALQAYKSRMGWSFTWVSSLNNDFNYDFNTSFTEQQQRSDNIDYNYSTLATKSDPGRQDRIRSRLDLPPPKSWAGDYAAMTGTDVSTYTREAPGMSAFALSEGVIYHTYSVYARGLDALWGMYQWLDRAPKGRNETESWFRRHDEYT
jgi:predicted dithiol-disulfide oxidoreductase (DUF899 family)